MHSHNPFVISIFITVLLMFAVVFLFRHRKLKLIYDLRSGISCIKLGILLPVIKYRYIILFKSGQYKNKVNKKSKMLNHLVDESGGFFLFVSEMLESNITKIFIDKIAVESHVGTGDAALTALTCGLFSAISGFLFSWIVEKYGNIEIIANISPDYFKTVLYISVVCIFEIRIIHIIVLVARYLYKYFKIYTKDRRCFFWRIQSKGL